MIFSSGCWISPKTLCDLMTNIEHCLKNTIIIIIVDQPSRSEEFLLRKSKRQIMTER